MVARPDGLCARLIVVEPDQDGRTPLHRAAHEACLADLISALDAGADPSAADRSGWTPLHFAAQAQAANAATALIEAGAEVDAQDVHGKTPLAVALFNVRDGDGEIISVLIASGASPDVQNHAGVSPRDLADLVANYDLKRHLPPPAG